MIPWSIHGSLWLSIVSMVIYHGQLSIHETMSSNLLLRLAVTWDIGSETFTGGESQLFHVMRVSS